MANLSNINNKFLVTTGGNVLINKTAANNATVGTQIMSTGDVNATVSGDTVARFNRLSSDGEIIRFQNDTATDGAINCLSGRIAIGSGNTGIFFDSIRQVVTPHNMTTNGNEFNNISFGRSLIRFKDIYLSGKIAAGTGTTAAATINAFTTTVSTGLHSALRILENTGASSYWDIGATNGTSTLLNFYHNANTSPKISFTHTGGATFAGTVSATNVGVNGFITHNGDSGTFMGWSADDTNVFYTAGNERLRIDASGNVGIGEDNPQELLHLTATTPVFRLEGGSHSYQQYVSGTSFYIRDVTNSSNRIVLDSLGNFGIGNTGPQYRLDVLGTSNQQDVLRLQSAWSVVGDYVGMGIGDGWIRNYVENSSKDYRAFAFAPRGTERMRIEAGGNVGIGTTSPTNKLGINSTSINTNERIINLYTGTTGPGKYVSIGAQYSTSNALSNSEIRFGNEVQSSSPSFLAFATGSSSTPTERMRITSAGVVKVNSGNLVGTGNGIHLSGARMNAIDNNGTTADNSSYLGYSSGRWIAVYAVSGTIQTSDVREKTEIKSTQLGLDFVNDLNPVSYKWIDGKRQSGEKTIKDKRQHQGLIAQEVTETLEKHGIDKNEFGGLDIQKTDKYNDFHGMSYEQFIAPMIKAIQELKAEIELLKNK